MHCSKCGFEDRGYTGRWRGVDSQIILIYCPHCGERLSEKCLNCGGMEWIGRPVCYCEYQRIVELFREVMRNEPRYQLSWWKLFLLLVAGLGTMVMLLPKGGDPFTWQGLFALLLGTIVSVSSVAWLRKKHDEAVEEAEARFWNEHPDLRKKRDQWRQWQQRDLERWSQSSGNK